MVLPMLSTCGCNSSIEGWGSSASSWQLVHFASPFKTMSWAGFCSITAGGASSANAGAIAPIALTKAIRINIHRNNFIIFSPGFSNFISK
jgi:hypothetical protein